MNKVKKNSKKQIILAAILVIGIGIIAINIIANNKAMAGAPSKCPNCGGSIATVTRKPTCTQAGKYIYSCPICQADVGEETIPALGHSYGNWNTIKSANCIEKGSRQRECIRCYNLVTEEIPINANNHKDLQRITKDPTCEEIGFEIDECSACGYRGEQIYNSKPALGHDYTRDCGVNQPATCTENEIRQYECERCRNSYEYREVPDTATGHRFSNSTDTVPGTFINATCEKGAQAKLYCQYCREPSPDWYVVSNPVPHSYEVVNTASTSICRMCKNCGATTGHNYEPTRIEPTCYKDGVTMDKCTNAGCTSEINKVILPATGEHDMYNDGVVQKAKCNVNRIDRWICRNEGCTYSYEKPVDGTALTHNFQKLIQEIPSTCYEKGKQIKQCVNEGCTETEESEVPWSELKPHKYVALNDGSGNCSVCSNEGCTSKISHNMVTDKEDATCLKDGHNKVYCSNAGCEKVEKDEIYPKTAHEKDDATKTFSSHPTCEHGTQYRYFCKYCGKAIWLYDSDKTDHNFVNGKCTVCGCEESMQTVQGITQFNINGTTVANIQLDTLAGNFATGIGSQNENVQVKLYNANNEAIEENEKLATGMKLEVTKEEATYIITLVLKGDVNGDGESGTLDMFEINQCRLHKKQLGVPYIQAADVDKNGNVNFLDIIRLNRFIRHKITEL